MRTTFISAAVLVGSFLFQSCTRSVDELTPVQIQVQTVSAGTWKVVLFTDGGTDETHKFSGYSFQFSTNGTLTAASSTGARSGTWKIESGSGKFVIDLGEKLDSNRPLGELTDDWKLISVSPAEIKLTDDNLSRAESLTFVRN